MGLAFPGLLAPPVQARKCDGGETHAGHHKENLAKETGPLSSLGVCSEPGTAGDHGWEGHEGSALLTAAQTSQTESSASWRVSKQAGGQAREQAGTLTVHSLHFSLASICYSLLLGRERSRQVSTTLSAPPVREGLKGQESREGV